MTTEPIRLDMAGPLHDHSYGFMWGPVDVTRMMHIPGRGRLIGIETETQKVQVYVSEKGRSIRVYGPDGRRWMPEEAR